MAPSCSYIIPHSFAVKHVLCLFSIRELQENKKPRLVTFTRVQKAQQLFGIQRSCFISDVELSKGDPSSSHLPPFERQTFHSGGALFPPPRAAVIILKSNFATTLALASSIFPSKFSLRRGSCAAVGSYSIIALIPAKSRRIKNIVWPVVPFEVRSRRDGPWPIAVRKYLQTESNQEVLGSMFPRVGSAFPFYILHCSISRRLKTGQKTVSRNKCTFVSTYIFVSFFFVCLFSDRINKSFTFRRKDAPKLRLPISKKIDRASYLTVQKWSTKALK